MRNAHLTDHVLALLLSWPLDRKLAAGRAPESSAVLSARARRITDPRRREDLARSWEHVVTRARQPMASHPLAVPLCRGRVIAAEPDIGELAARLRSPAPASPRGVAAAHLLLTDGLGPLYDLAAPGESLLIHLREAIEHLAPSPARRPLSCLARLI